MEDNDYSIHGEEEMLDFYQKLRKNIRKQLWWYHIFGQCNKCDFRWSNVNRVIRY